MQNSQSKLQITLKFKRDDQTFPKSQEFLGFVDLTSLGNHFNCVHKLLYLIVLKTISKQSTQKMKR